MNRRVLGKILKGHSAVRERVTALRSQSHICLDPQPVSTIYRAPGKGLYMVARNFCLSMPGCCLSKYTYLFRGLCKYMAAHGVKMWFKTASYVMFQIPMSFCPKSTAAIVIRQTKEQIQALLEHRSECPVPPSSGDSGGHPSSPFAANIHDIILGSFVVR